jgi:hypothetical protein
VAQEEITDDKAAVVGFLIQRDAPLALFAAQKLADFWRRACGGRVAVQRGERGDLKPGWCWAGVEKERSGDRDGYRVGSVSLPEGAAWEIGAATEMGLKQGLWRLLREVDLEPSTVSMPKRLAVAEHPFFAQRYCKLSTPLIWYRYLTPGEERFAYQWWEREERLRYVTSLDMMGFNALQVADEGGEQYATRFERRGDYWKKELEELLSHAGRLGLHRILFVWAASAAHPYIKSSIPGTFAKGLNPNDAEEGPLWEAHLDHVAGYAPFIEEVLTHWGDPGGYEGATIEDAQRLHMTIWERFQRKNPEVASLFSLWMLHSPRYGKWKGYEGPETILKGGILPKEVGLAMHARIRMDEAKQIKGAGRRCGPWVWYLADNEVFPALHVHTGWMDEYFQGLPVQAAEIVDFHGIELNCHLLNLASVYVGSRKLWDPYRRADECLEEFCSLTFGPKAGSAVCAGYQAVAQSRCISDYGLREQILAVSDSRDPQQYMGSPRSELEILDKALEKVRGLEPDLGWIPRLPLPLEPQSLIEDLTAHLEEIRKYARFRMDLQAVQRGEKTQESLSDWNRPDGYLLAAEKIRVAGHLHKLRGGNIFDYF